MEKECIDIVLCEYDYGTYRIKRFDNNEYVEDYSWLSQNLEEKICKLENMYENILHVSELDPENMVGFRTIQEVKHFFNYKLYVATLLSSEYKNGKVLVYCFNKEKPYSLEKEDICTIEDYIETLSKLTDENLKAWLRHDLQ